MKFKRGSLLVFTVICERYLDREEMRKRKLMATISLNAQISTDNS
jgi:hypothetical protein